MDSLYPEIEPFRQFALDVGDGHRIHVEQCGNPDGVPILFVHGGPGGGCDPRARRFFDPKHYHIVLFDQRGCGRSTPFAEIRVNTTWHLVADMEAIRERLGIDRWALFGGSWGSTLSLAYAEAHPERVTALVLRGIFLSREEDMQWFYFQGAPQVYPEYYREFLAPVPEAGRSDLVAAYRILLEDDDAAVRERAAQAWTRWELRASNLVPDEEALRMYSEPRKAVPMARLEVHYFANDCFLEPGQLLRDIGRIRHLPGFIVQGRYDLVCPPEAAWALHEAWPEAAFEWVPRAGHSAFEPGIIEALVR
ncbi:MAG: prolyl aminopeptidase, partial [Proteobacteria bacterium]|nr:prolyl aminopeptidase [Pseudomonadota bacterium]